MLRLVLDTDVIVAGMRSPTGASAALLKAARYGQIQLLASTPMMLEYESVCSRNSHMAAAGLVAANVETFLNTLCAIMEYVDPFYSWRPQLTDADDEMVLETAINGKANALVTFNIRDYGNIPEQFGVQLWRPNHAINRIQQ